MRPFRLPPSFVRLGARLTSRRALDPRLPWEVQRRRLDRLARTWPLVGSPPAAKTTMLNGVPAEVIEADGAGPVTVVHFHGGGYCVGSPGESRDWATHLSGRAGCRMILPDYRLAPEHPFPAALDDARDALDAVLAEAAPGPVIVSGDSAGGGLALALAQGEVEARGTTPRLAGCMLMSPWLDLTADWTADPGLARRDAVLTPHWLRACADAYARDADRSRPEISPLLGELKGLPPLLIQCGADDLVAPDSERLEALAREAGVPVTSSRWPGLWHNFPLQPGLIAAADAAVEESAAFIAKVRATWS